MSDADAYHLLLQAAAATTAAGVILASTWRWIVTPLRVLVVEMRSAWATLALVRADLRPNGGSSVRDAIDRIERAVQLGAQRSYALVSALELAVWESDAAGGCIWASPKLCEMWGLSCDEMRGHGWITGIAERDREIVRAEWDRAVREKRRFSLVYRSAAGVRLRGQSICVRDPHGAVIGHVGTLTKIAANELQVIDDARVRVSDSQDETREAHA